MEIGKSLKEKRTELNLTQEEVAKEIMVSRQTISNWENGKSYPDIENLVLLSNLYNISLDGLLKNNIEETKKLQESIKNEVKYYTFFKTVSIFIVVIIIALTLLISPKESEFMLNIVPQIASYLQEFSIIGIIVFYFNIKKEDIHLSKKSKVILGIILMLGIISFLLSFISGLYRGRLDALR